MAIVYVILRVLAAFAAGIDDWPRYAVLVLLGIGLLLTVISLSLAKSASTTLERWLGYAINGGTLVIYIVLIVGIFSLWLNVTRRLFLVPAGFQGDLFVVHLPNHGEKGHEGYERTTYSFPNDGVLVTQDPSPTSFSDEYDYIYPDGHRQKLSDAGPGTLQDTQENRADDKEVVTYFARSSPAGPWSPCAFEEISIGTKAFLLSKHSDSPPPEITHPGICR